MAETANQDWWRIVYVSSQDFMNELITSIRFDGVSAFPAQHIALTRIP
jgi:chromosomal replication initiation ATPase DnaA